MEFKEFLLAESVEEGFLGYIHDKWTKEYDRHDPRLQFEILIGNNQVDVEFASPYHPDIRTALGKIPDVSNFKLTFDGHNAGTVSSFIKSKVHEDNIVHDWFHGTAGFYAEQILKNGLRPRAITNIHPSFIGGAKSSKEDLVYLSSDDGNDVRFAARDANSKVYKLHPESKPTILRIDPSMLSPSKYVPDEDSDKSSWLESLYKTGTVGYKGIILPKAISIHMVLVNGLWRKYGI